MLEYIFDDGFVQIKLWVLIEEADLDILVYPYFAAFGIVTVGYDIEHGAFAGTVFGYEADFVTFRYV